MAPPALVDYIVAHELAHLRVRGHGADYWGIVAHWKQVWSNNPTFEPPRV